MNVQIKPHFCIPPDTITGIFKGFIEGASKICSEKYLGAEIEYPTDILCEIEHNRKILQKMINSFEKKTRDSNNNNNNKNNANKKQIITFAWIPKIRLKLKKEIQKFGFRVAFQKQR